MAEGEKVSIMASDGINEQVILPTNIAFGICIRGIKTRLGRSLVTLAGVALGIAFLTAVAASFSVKKAMMQDQRLADAVAWRITVLRGEIGNFKDRRLLIVPATLDKTDEGVIRELKRMNADIRVALPADPNATEQIEQFIQSLSLSKAKSLPDEARQADLVMFFGPFDTKLVNAIGEGLADKKTYVFHPLEGESRKLLVGLGAKVSQLKVTQTQEDIDEAQRKEKEEDSRRIWILVVSLMITFIGITNAMLMSVTERVREIGTMKCLGALSGFVVKLFLIESSLVGLTGATIGSALGIIFSLLTYSYQFGLVTVFTRVNYGELGLLLLVCTTIGGVLAIIAGIYPARIAAKMIPAAALATHV